MFKRMTLAAVIAALMFAPPLGSSALSGSPVRVDQCSPNRGAPIVGYTPGFYPMGGYWPDVYGYRYHEWPVRSNPILDISYVNVSRKVASSVEFGLVARGALVAEVRDVGTFTPRAQIQHTFGLNPSVFPLGTALPQCVPLRIQYTDGTQWKNPNLPALRRSLYQ